MTSAYRSPLTSYLSLLKQLSSACQYFVQCFLEVRSRVGHLPSDLFRILLPALLDLLLEQLLEVAITEALLSLAGMVHDHVRNEGPSQTSSLECRILRQERVGRASSRRGWRGPSRTRGRNSGRCCRFGGTGRRLGRCRGPNGSSWSRRHHRSDRAGRPDRTDATHERGWRSGSRGCHPWASRASRPLR